MQFCNENMFIFDIVNGCHFMWCPMHAIECFSLKFIKKVKKNMHGVWSKPNTRFFVLRHRIKPRFDKI